MTAESIARERYGHAIGQFVFARYRIAHKGDVREVRRIGVLKDIFDENNILRIKHRDKEIFWDVPALEIVEFEAQPVKSGEVGKCQV
jgi:hypothetical protein